jgi:hypothetical protein
VEELPGCPLARMSFALGGGREWKTKEEWSFDTSSGGSVGEIVMIDIPEIERVLTTMDAKRAKDSSAIWTIDQLVWPFGSRQKKLSAGKSEILKLLIQSEVGAYLVIDEEDEMVRVPHAHRLERDCTWQLEPCIMLEDLQNGPLSYGSWSLYGAPGQWIQRIFKILNEFHLLSVFKGFAALACTIFFGPSLMKLAGGFFYPCR